MSEETWADEIRATRAQPQPALQPALQFPLDHPQPPAVSYFPGTNEYVIGEHTKSKRYKALGDGDARKLENMPPEVRAAYDAHKAVFGW